MPTAAVCIGPALVVTELVSAPAIEVAELTAEPTELVRLSIRELRDEATDPVAVASSDDRDSMMPPAPLVIELTRDDASELMELRAEPMELVRDEATPPSEVLVVMTVVSVTSVAVVVSWAYKGEKGGCRSASIQTGVNRVWIYGGSERTRASEARARKKAAERMLTMGLGSV
ncbi:hypothetical protein VTG60DRAFT_1117 [Thermothelomyces hinnuleus]